MRLSVQTSIYYKNRPDGKGYSEAVRRISDAGFRVVDFSTCPMQRNDSELNSDNWEAVAYELANESAKLGVVFEQSHLPYPKATIRRRYATDEGCEGNEYFIGMTKRAIKISGILGVRWAVVHPVMKVANSCADIESDIAYNHKIYDGYIGLADSLGVGIAFENIADVDGKRRFGATADELNLLIDSYGDDKRIGVCWDFGHANRVFGADQKLQLEKILSRLRATHINDNVGTDDLHTLPFLGQIRWEEIMPLLKGYEGALNFEIRYTQCFPEQLKDETAAFTYRIGQHLISLMES